MSDEPYQASKIPNHWPDSLKRVVIGKFVAISGLRLKQRGTKLMHPRSRALPKSEIVELTATDDQAADPGSEVNSVLYIGFFEVQQGGIVVVGEDAQIGGETIGKITGFSDIHSPNHLNIILKGSREFISKFMDDSVDKTMVKLYLHLEDIVIFGQKEEQQ